MTTPGSRTGAFDAFGERATGAGEPVRGGANRMVVLDDADVVWFVESGSLDVFVVECRDAEFALGASRLKHVFRAGPGEVAFAFLPDESALRLVAKGSADARLRRVPLSALLDKDLVNALSRRVEVWVTALCAAVVRDITLRPRIERRIESPGEAELPAEAVVAARRGVAWIEVPDDGAGATYLDTEALDGEGLTFVPLTCEAWLRLRDPIAPPCATTEQLASRGVLSRALADFHCLIARAELFNRQLLLADAAQAQMESRRHQLASEHGARRGLADLLRHGTGWLHGRADAVPDDRQSVLAAALAAIGEWEDIRFREPRTDGRDSCATPMLDDILRASGVRGRRVTLAVEDRWWRGDSGALLGFLREGDVPVALLPGRTGGYRMVTPRGTRHIDAAGARSLHPHAWTFLRSLPDERKATGGDLLRAAGTRLGSDLVRVSLLGLLVGMVLLAPAIVFGLLTDHFIPAGAAGALLQSTALLVVLGGVGALLQILQGTTLLKLEARLALRLDAAIQDRMYKLAPAFMRRFTTGDLAMRASTFRTLRDRVSGTVLQSLLSAVFLLPTFAFLFFYDITMGWIGLALGATVLTLGAVLGLGQLEPQRRWFDASREVASVLRQFLNSMGKLRTTGAQASAYAIWAQRYREQQRAFVDIGTFDHHLVALGVAAPAFAGTVLLWAAWTHFDGTTGDFLAIYAAFMVFNLAITRLASSFSALAGVWPGVAQVRPLLEQQPDPRLVSAETTGGNGRAALGGARSRGRLARYANSAPDSDPDTSTRRDVEIRGGLGIHNVSWGYDDGPGVLEDVSLHADPGEFIAIVGESGAGKSTLLRLALGLARPMSGYVSYDGRDLEHLNAVSIRRQVSVVLQDGDLPDGSLEDAILGISNSLTISDAWRAARLAAVSDDIAAMPMGMHTVIGSNGATLSGGQVQRIQIAAALARDPRILILDEATNWLDNRRQAEVMRNIERLEVTRIVVAHRMSTIRHADRIYVLEAGKVVQEGSYGALADREGTFRDLVRRQLA